MSFTIALAQCAHPEDGDVVASVARWTCRAAEAGADLLVFPEALMTKFDGSIERFVAQAQPLDGPFARAIDALAAKAGLWIAYTMNERNPEGGLPFNTAVIADAKGRQRARYRKVHLFDAQGYRESERMAGGPELMAPLAAPFANLGMAICYDLRFPEVARMAALAGAQVMLLPAAWVDGPGKTEQWETLLRARAIENGFFVAGVCSADAQRVGHSCVFAPDGTPLAIGADRTEDLVVCDIDLAAIEQVRSATPSLEHRRPDCYA